MLTIGMVLFPKIHRQGLLQQIMGTLKPQMENGMAILSAQIESIGTKCKDTIKEKYMENIKTE